MLKYQELINFKHWFWGRGPSGYLLKRYKDLKYDEGRLLYQTYEIDFVLDGFNGNISESQGLKLLIKAVSNSGYSSWFFNLVEFIIGIFGLFLTIVQIKNGEAFDPAISVLCLFAMLVVLGIYATLRRKYEDVRDRLIDALNHLLILVEEL